MCDFHAKARRLTPCELRTFEQTLGHIEGLAKMLKLILFLTVSQACGKRVVQAADSLLRLSANYGDTGYRAVVAANCSEALRGRMLFVQVSCLKARKLAIG